MKITPATDYAITGFPFSNHKKGRKQAMNINDEKAMEEAVMRHPDIYRYAVCPVCTKKTLDNYWICSRCGWEYDESGENDYSVCNGTTLKEYREGYKKGVNK